MNKNVLLIDINIVGHHMAYIKSLCNVNKELNNKIFIMLPEGTNELNEFEVLVEPNIRRMKESQYYKLVLKKICEIVKINKIDIVHFLSGDILYKFFGWKLKKLKSVKTIMTFHHFQKDFLHKVSIKRIFKKIDMGICHTDTIIQDLKICRIKNVIKVDYPYFGETKAYELTTLKTKYEIDDENPIYLCLGETRYEKGLDIFLEACEKVSNINLIIAGKERDITISQIDNIIKEKNLNFPIVKIIRFLSDEELNELLYLTDYVVLPYRRCFDGASGPLVEGVMYKKCIIGPRHGSLGDLISRNQLGYCFETENTNDLHRVIEDSKGRNFSLNEKYLSFRDSLSVKTFILKYKKIYEEELK